MENTVPGPHLPGWKQAQHNSFIVSLKENTTILTRRQWSVSLVQAGEVFVAQSPDNPPNFCPRLELNGGNPTAPYTFPIFGPQAKFQLIVLHKHEQKLNEQNSRTNQTKKKSVLLCQHASFHSLSK